VPLPRAGLTVPTLDVATLTPERAAALVGRPGRFVFVPTSRPDDVDGCLLVEADGPPGYLRTVSFDPSEEDEGPEPAGNPVPEVADVIGLPNCS